MGASSNINNVFGLAVGTYFVTVTDANGCSAVDTAIITEPPPLVLTTASTNAACGVSDGSATVTSVGGTGAYTYVWNDPFTQTTTTADSLGAGSYTVVVTDSNACVASASVTVNNTGGASITVDSVVNVTCNGDADGTVNITTSGGLAPLTYLWSNTATTEDLVGLTAGIYNLTVTDGAGCLSILDTSISEPTAIIVSTSSIDISCFGSNDGSGTATASGGASPYVYLWNDLLAQTTGTAMGLDTGSFTATITDAMGCSASGSVTIAEPAPII